MPATAAVIFVTALAFEDADPNIVNMSFMMQANDPLVPPITGGVPFPRNATQSVKQTAVRESVNAIIQSFIPGNPLLTNAVIQISGLPV
jgi:hypothetical protein